MTLRFDMRTAQEMGFTNPVKEIMKELGFTILKYEGVPMADCVMFEVEETDVSLPEFLTPVDYKIEKSTTGI